MYLLQYLLRSYDSKNRYSCSCGRWNFLWADEGNKRKKQSPRFSSFCLPGLPGLPKHSSCLGFWPWSPAPGGPACSSRDLRQGRTRDSKIPRTRALGFELTPSGFVILSCKTKAFQVVLSKYGKSLVLSTQRVHPGMACGTGEPQHATSVLGRTQNTGYLCLSCQKSKGKIPSLLTFMICRQTQLLCWR